MRARPFKSHCGHVVCQLVICSVCPLQMVETSPFDALSHAALAWLRQNLAQCDMLHLHEWGGTFVDVITASAYRQLKPGVLWHCKCWCKYMKAPP
jgi:hypothetical protein